MHDNPTRCFALAQWLWALVQWSAGNLLSFFLAASSLASRINQKEIFTSDELICIGDRFLSLSAAGITSQMVERFAKICNQSCLIYICLTLSFDLILIFFDLYCSILLHILLYTFKVAIDIQHQLKILAIEFNTVNLCISTKTFHHKLISVFKLCLYFGKNNKSNDVTY